MKIKHIFVSLALGALFLCAPLAAPQSVSAAGPVLDNTIADPYVPSTGIVAAPTVVCDLTDSSVLDSFQTAGEVLPSNVIVHFNDKAEAEGENGEVLGTFEDLYTETLQGRMIPVLYLKNRQCAEAAVKYLTETRDMIDVAVMADAPDLVSYVRGEVPQVRGIVRFDEVGDPFEVVKTVNSSLANVAVLSGEAATRANVDFIQARFKTVWTYAEGPLGVQSAIMTGAYGVISSSYWEVLDVIENDFPVGNGTYYTRMPYNVAHRGMGSNGTGSNVRNEYHENSVSACLAATEVGATHLEVDAYVTTDDVVVMMHDGDIGRTTDGQGNIENFSFEQLSQYHLDVAPEPEAIPTLSDILDIVKEKGVILVLEIKSAKVDRFLAAFRETVESKCAADSFDYWRYLVVISFDRNILRGMKNELPEVPTADLNSTTSFTEAQLLTHLTAHNTGVDAPLSEANNLRENFLRARGYVGWYWTYDRFFIGYETQGITNNGPIAEGEVKQVSRGSGADGVTVGDPVTLIAEDYTGVTHEVEGTVAFSEEDGKGGHRVIAQYDNGQFILFTEAYTVGGSGGEQEESGGCGSVLFCSPVLLACALPFLFVRRKK